MSEKPSYAVGEPEVSGAKASELQAAQRPRAVFVAHGMGQQVPFQTLDDVARGLCTAIEAGGGKVKERTAKTVRVGCEVVQRLELTLDRGAPIHIYEAYWAPLTEGVIGLWQVVRFLVSGGLNAIRSGGKLFRFLFRHPREFHVPVSSIVGLLVALVFILSVVIVGTTALAVALGKLMLATDPWMNETLITHLTGTFELLLAWVFAWVLISIAVALISRRVKALRISLWIHAAPVILAFVAAAYLAIPLDLVYDTRSPISMPSCASCPISSIAFPDFSECHALLDELRACDVREPFLWWVLLVAAGAACLFALYFVYRAHKKRNTALEYVERYRGGGIGGVIASVALLVLVVMLCGNHLGLAYATWILLVAIVLFLRKFLIEYVGDVAIYVSPHVVDRFFDVRQRIKTTIWKAARAVYAFEAGKGKFLYDRVAVVGHSLGSVVVYDALNRLINEDGLAVGSEGKVCDDVPIQFLNVAERTKLLLTFGSPLDKTAFVFAMHDAGGGSERDALAASVQPLITRERKLQWVNVHSPYDILGGKLDYYDTPKNDKKDPNTNRIDNIEDPDAVTPFVAHVEFWDHPLIYNQILQYLV